MSFIALIFGLGGPQTSIGALTLDALLSEDTELNSEVSKYPVEDGPPVTDHISPGVERLSLSGIVTAASVTMFGAGGRSKLMAAKESLRLIYENRVPITIVTGLDVYTNMGMTNARIGKSNRGEMLSIDCEFQKIVKTITRQADIPATTAKPAPGGGKGTGANGKAGATQAKAGKASTAAGDAVDPGAMKESTLYGLTKGKQTRVGDVLAGVGL